VLFDDRLEVLGTFREGICVYVREGALETRPPAPDVS
jgi:hypothetical protein